MEFDATPFRDILTLQLGRFLTVQAVVEQILPGNA